MKVLLQILISLSFGVLLLSCWPKAVRAEHVAVLELEPHLRYVGFEPPLLKISRQSRTGRALCRIRLHPALGTHRRVRFEIQFSSAPRGYCVAIGDSRTNNGFGGDAGTQTHDAEFQIFNDCLYVFGSDATPRELRPHTGGTQMAQVPAIVTADSTLVIDVADGVIRWDNGRGIADGLEARQLFALAGQADQQGPSNYDLYAAFNRSIGDDTRQGSGVARVVIRLLAEGETPSAAVPVVKTVK